MLRLVDFAIGEPRAESMRIVETIEVHFRLGVMMRRVGRPFPRMAQHLAEHHIGKRRVVIVKERLDVAAHTSHEFAVGTRPLCLHGLRRIHHGFVLVLVQRVLHIQFAVGVGGQLDFRALARQQTVGLVMETVRAARLAGLAVPFIRHVAFKQKNRYFLIGALILVSVAVLHYQQAHVHHRAHLVCLFVDIDVIAPLEFGLEIGHGSRLPYGLQSRVFPDILPALHRVFQRIGLRGVLFGLD